MRLHIAGREGEKPPDITNIEKSEQKLKYVKFLSEEVGTNHHCRKSIIVGDSFVSPSVKIVEY